MVEKELILLTQERATIYENTFLSSYNREARKRLFNGHSFCIAVTPGETYLSGFLGNPYIKLCSSDSLGDARLNPDNVGVSRIALRYPQMIYHKQRCREVRITTGVLESLTEAMKFPCSYGTVRNGTLLECINEFLTIQAKEENLNYNKIESVNFYSIGNITDYKGKTIKIC